MRLHDRAGIQQHQHPMEPEMKKELLIATLRDLVNQPAKGLDGRSFIGPQSYPADLPDDQIETFDMVVALLVNKYDEKQEDISVTTVASRFKLIK